MLSLTNYFIFTIILKRCKNLWEREALKDDFRTVMIVTVTVDLILVIFLYLLFYALLNPLKL